MKPIQKMLCIQDQIVMSDFCYAYCMALLNKLNKLAEEKRIFVGNKEVIRYGGLPAYKVTPITVSVMRALCKQIDLPLVIDDTETAETVSCLISTATEFLDMFEKKE